MSLYGTPLSAIGIAFAVGFVAVSALLGWRGPASAPPALLPADAPAHRAWTDPVRRAPVVATTSRTRGAPASAAASTAE